MSAKKKPTKTTTTVAKTAKTAPATSTTKAADTPKANTLTSPRPAEKATTATTKTVKATSSAKVAPNKTYTAQEIAERAYYLWVERGENHGSDVEDWLKAEKELTVAV